MGSFWYFCARHACRRTDCPGEAKRARRRWREAMRTWQEIESVAVEIQGEHNKLPRHNAPDMVAAIREGVTEQLKKRSA